MNFEEILLPSVVYDYILLSIIAILIPWLLLRKRFLTLLEQHEPEVWLELGSPKGVLILNSFKDMKVESFIAKKKWASLESEELKSAAKKVFYVHKVLVSTVAIFCILFFGPLLISQIPR